MIFLNTNTIFNTDTHAAEMRRVAILVRYVEAPVPQLSNAGSLKGTLIGRKGTGQDPRLNSNAHPRPQRRTPRLARRVMNIKTDIVAQMMGQERFDRLAGHVEA